MTIQQQLEEQGHMELAHLYQKRTPKAMKELMIRIGEHPDVNYSSIRLVVEQLKAISEISDLTSELVWSDVQAVVEEFLILEKESSFPYQVDEDDVNNYKDAVAGNPEAILSLAHRYREQGYDEQAYAWYQLGEKLGLAAAIYWVGNYMYIGEVAELDMEAIYNAYKKAADLDYPDAINNLADMYLKGEYVEQDDLQAFILFKKAAEYGVAESMYTMGYLFKLGRGTEKNADLSAYWFEQSALHGDVFALNKMGHQAFEAGNDSEALQWYLKAAELEDVQGQYNVGFCYESGIGTEINVKKAKKWYKKAALQGDQLSKDRLKELARG